MVTHRSRDLALPGSHPRRAARSRAQVVSIGVALTMLAGALAAGLFFLYVWQGVRIHELTAQREAAQIQLSDIEDLNIDLGVQIQQAYSLARIARIAREQLGMVDPTVIRYVPLPSAAED